MLMALRTSTQLKCKQRPYNLRSYSEKMDEGAEGENFKLQRWGTKKCDGMPYKWKELKKNKVLGFTYPQEKGLDWNLSNKPAISALIKQYPKFKLSHFKKRVSAYYLRLATLLPDRQPKGVHVFHTMQGAPVGNPADEDINDGNNCGYLLDKMIDEDMIVVNADVDVDLDEDNEDASGVWVGGSYFFATSSPAAQSGNPERAVKDLAIEICSELESDLDDRSLVQLIELFNANVVEG
ncbi:hypothetical protein SERLA73DRAFT_149026 [Serpula lacrymans var. lacrymans S7.3]|uniref:Uncharacterized protein n=1 Tax=Serpula lacrymans var. lacrymans (strain S7.3) TaxID=936435 RepID=F8PHU0_SERL3|nr:hypothetical protein SERLA73DRAFT_149026 [Serpula lacrymans var. lacrymans S7.3]